MNFMVPELNEKLLLFIYLLFFYIMKNFYTILCNFLLVVFNFINDNLKISVIIKIKTQVIL